MAHMSIEYVDHMGTDLTVVNAARVSLHKEKTALDFSDQKLIRYCAANNHWSPFSHPKIMVRVKMPFFVARQWEKHRVGVVRGYDIYDQNEVSRRYVDGPPEIFAPAEWRTRPDGSIKQGSGGPHQEQGRLTAIYDSVMIDAQAAYRRMLDEGVAPEQARMVLPVSAMTEWVETGSLVYWARLYMLRIDSHAQAEIRELASIVGDIMEPLFPVSWLALTNRWSLFKVDWEALAQALMKEFELDEEAKLAWQNEYTNLTFDSAPASKS